MKQVQLVFFSLAALYSLAAYSSGYVNESAPVLAVEKWVTPEPNTKGKFVLLEFWATWCPGCRQSIPHLNDLQRKYSDKLVVIGLSDEKEEAINNLAAPRPVYALALDSQRRNETQLGIDRIPQLLVIDRGGAVRWKGDPRQLREAQLDALLQLRPEGQTKPKSTTSPAQAPPVMTSNPAPSRSGRSAANVPSGSRKRIAFQLKDGSWVEGEFVGSFANRTTLRLANGRQVDIKASDVVSREE